LLLLWAALSFGVGYFARALQYPMGDWSLGYWLAAQGAVLGFIAIVVFYAWWMNRQTSEPTPESTPDPTSDPTSEAPPAQDAAPHPGAPHGR